MAVNKPQTKNLFLVVLGMILLNIFGSYYYKRFDLTQDKRFALSIAAKGIITTMDSPIFIEVFLELHIVIIIKKSEANSL